MAKHLFIAGIDEVGRGPLAGPVTAACVVLPPGYRNSEVKDSKKLTPEIRHELDRELRRVALAFSVVSVGSRRIDRLNIREASRLAMKLSSQRVVQALARKLRISHSRVPITFLIDGNVSIETNFAQETIVQGDGFIQAIAAASILAKVARDGLMTRLDERYSGYGFAKHKGYFTQEHQAAVEALGPTWFHRRSFRPIRECFEATAVGE